MNLITHWKNTVHILLRNWTFLCFTVPSHLMLFEHISSPYILSSEWSKSHVYSHFFNYLFILQGQMCETLLYKTYNVDAVHSGVLPWLIRLQRLKLRLQGVGLKIKNTQQD